LSAPPERLVVDASVALLWLVPEPASPRAMALRDRDLHAPDLILSECANALWKKAGWGEIDATEAAEIGAALLEMPIKLTPGRDLLLRALKLAIGLGHPAYDCFYLALAERTGCPLVTVDRRLLATARRSPGLAALVLPLESPGI
jgi:predicted nucleic acid-binding protein